MKTILQIVYFPSAYLSEARTDFRLLQELLGHRTSNSSDIYALVSKKSSAKIKSPLDQILEVKS
jgi:integrase/recombinase XerD